MIYWFIVAVLLFIVELFLGTVYLLVVSLALLGAGLMAWLLGDVAGFWVAAILSLAGIVWVYHYKKRNVEQVSDVSDDFDIGQTVVLESLLPTGEWRVQYRGTLWEARNEFSGSLKAGDTAKIVARDGNILII